MRRRGGPGIADIRFGCPGRTRPAPGAPCIVGSALPQFQPRAAPAIGTLSLREDEVDVWFARLDLSREPSDRDLQALPRSEAERAASMGEEPRRRFVAARSQLRRLLAAYLAAEPAGIGFSYGGQGKPRLGGAHAASGIHFNLSHTGRRALVAVARSPVGVDLETVRPLGDTDRLARRILSDRERRDLGKLPATARNSAFLACWTRKEAYAKAVGEGIVRTFRRFAVTLKPESEPALLREDGTPDPGWTILHVEPEAGVVGALAVRRADCSPRFWLLEPPETGRPTVPSPR